MVAHPLELEDGWIDRLAAMRQLGVTAQTVRLYERAGLPSVKVMGRRFYRAADVRAWRGRQEANVVTG